MRAPIDRMALLKLSGSLAAGSIGSLGHSKDWAIHRWAAIGGTEYPHDIHDIHALLRCIGWLPNMYTIQLCSSFRVDMSQGKSKMAVLEIKLIAAMQGGETCIRPVDRF